MREAWCPSPPDVRDLHVVRARPVGADLDLAVAVHGLRREVGRAAHLDESPDELGGPSGTSRWPTLPVTVYSYPTVTFDDVRGLFAPFHPGLDRQGCGEDSAIHTLECFDVLQETVHEIRSRRGLIGPWPVCPVDGHAHKPETAWDAEASTAWLACPDGQRVVRIGRVAAG